MQKRQTNRMPQRIQQVRMLHPVLRQNLGRSQTVVPLHGTTGRKIDGTGIEHRPGLGGGGGGGGGEF
jgi:hypothetical protein